MMISLPRRITTKPTRRSMTTDQKTRRREVLLRAFLLTFTLAAFAGMGVLALITEFVRTEGGDWVDLAVGTAACGAVAIWLSVVFIRRVRRNSR